MTPPQIVADIFTRMAEPIVAVVADDGLGHVVVYARCLGHLLDRARGQLRYQYAGGFYPAGAIIAVRVAIGAATAEAWVNPAAPGDLALLERLAGQAQIQAFFYDQESTFRFSRAVLHRPLARRELGYLLDKARKHTETCARLSWEETVRAFSADAPAGDLINEIAPARPLGTGRVQG